jgi:hypothetical protein
MSVSSSSRSGAHCAAAADFAQDRQFVRAAATVADVDVDGHLLRHRQFAVVKGRQSTPCCDARERLHTDLSSRSLARSASCARVSRDFTVPIAIPSENAISS